MSKSVYNIKNICKNNNLKTTLKMFCLENFVSCWQIREIKHHKKILKMNKYKLISIFVTKKALLNNGGFLLNIWIFQMNNMCFKNTLNLKKKY